MAARLANSRARSCLAATWLKHELVDD